MFVSLHTVLPADGTGVPEWVHLVPAGTIRTADGRGPYKLQSAAAVIAASAETAIGGKWPIDENHSTDLAAPRGEEAPAKGWIVELQARADGIWGRVEWNESGRALLADKSYRGFSPVFETDKSGNVLRLLRAALTNNPNLPQLATLNHQEHTMDLVQLRTTLGLAADADEAAIVAAIGAAVTERTAHAARITALQTQIAGAVKPEIVTQMQTQIATLQQDAARTKAVAFVDAQISAGKPIAPLRDHYVTRHMADPTAVETELGKLPSIHAGGAGEHIVVRHDMADGDTLTETESSICKRMGLDPKEYAKNFKKKAA